MTGPTHLAIAAVATIVLNQETGMSPPGLMGWVVMLGGSLLPDIDEPKSTVSNPAGIFTKVMPRWVRDMINIPFRAASKSIRDVFGHRGATHYLLWPAIMFWLSWYNGSPLLWWFAWGYLWHELADWITKVGIPAAGPFYSKNITLFPKSFRVKTGGPVENLINTACWLYLLYSAYIYF
ncbi:MAG: metal-dependent hydrolase [Chloroflexota bacterium]